MPIKPSNSSNPVATFVTSAGVVDVELLPAQAPITVGNFLTYVDAGFYDAVVFHRLFKPTGVGPAIVAQAGLLAAGGGRSYAVRAPIAEPIVLESRNGLSNTLGTLAMARTLVPDSASAQFYFNTADNAADFDYINPANPGYAVFGKTLKGLDVLAGISNAQTITANGQALGLGVLADFPAQDIVIDAVRTTRFFAGKRADYRVTTDGEEITVTALKNGEATSVAQIDRLQFKDRSLGVNELMTGVLATSALLLRAEADNAALTGLGTADELFAGGFANVRLDGGLGNDTLTGGAGADQFVFSTLPNAKTNLDPVVGFDPAADRLLLSRAVFAGSGAAGELPGSALVSGTKPVARSAEPALLYNTRSGDLAWDADGSGKVKPVVFARLVGMPALAAEDVVLVDLP